MPFVDILKNRIEQQQQIAYSESPPYGNSSSQCDK